MFQNGWHRFVVVIKHRGMSTCEYALSISLFQNRFSTFGSSFSISPFNPASQKSSFLFGNKTLLHGGSGRERLWRFNAVKLFTKQGPAKMLHDPLCRFPSMFLCLSPYTDGCYSFGRLFKLFFWSNPWHSSVGVTTSRQTPFYLPPEHWWLVGVVL